MIDRDAKLPTYGTDESAGADLYTTADVIVEPGKTEFVHTGIAMAIPEGYAGFIYARSGLSCRSGLAPANKVGVIDSDYRGEIVVALHNHSDKSVMVARHERVAQICFESVEQAEFNLVDELEETERNVGGFGSTGK